MNFRIAILLLGTASPLLSQEASSSVSASRVDLLDQRGYFTPACKSAFHRLVEAHQTLTQIRATEKRLHADMPGLKKDSAEAARETEKLRGELALYEHPEDTDFQALKAAMTNISASDSERLSLAQAFVWSYPTDPRQAEALADLQQIQKEQITAQQSVAEAAAARSSARATLIQRAKARRLTLPEWQSFLDDMSQEDVLHYLGPPQTTNANSWTYGGSWITDPITKSRQGLQISFNGTRVLNVVPVSP